MGEFWWLRGHRREWRRRLDAALACAEAASDVARAQVLLMAGVYDLVTGDYT